MNEIIVKLAEQAAEHAVLNPSESVLQSEADGSKVEIPAEFINKLAKLIVKECCEQITQGPFYAGGAAKYIKEHFGVEE